MFWFVRNACQRDNKAIRLGRVWHSRGFWGDGGRDMGTRSSQEENLKGKRICKADPTSEERKMRACEISDLG